MRSCSTSPARRARRAGGAPSADWRGLGIPPRPPAKAAFTFIAPRRLSCEPLTRARVRLLGPCFKTGRVGGRHRSHGPLIWPSICLPAAAGLFSAPLLGEQKGHSCQGHGLSMTALPTAILPRGFQAGEGRGPLKCLWCHCTRGCPFCPQSRPLTDHGKNAHTSLPLLSWGLQGGGVSPLTLKSRSQLEPTPPSQPSRPTRLSVLASKIHYFLLTNSGQACIISCLDY